MNISNKSIDLDGKGMKYLCKRRKEGERERRKGKAQKLYLEKMFLTACLKPEMSHFSFICFWFKKGKRVNASLF